MGVPVWLEDAAGLGAVAAGLALPLAFVQLGALRRDRLRGQVDKVGVWLGKPHRLDKAAGEVWWALPLRVRNASELPVFVSWVVVIVQPTGSGSGPGLLKPVPTGKRGKMVLRRELPEINAWPGIIGPGETWAGDLEYHQEVFAERPDLLQAGIKRVEATDSAGRSWRIGSGLTAWRVYRRPLWRWWLRPHRFE
jgi:hypothetical protein